MLLATTILCPFGITSDSADCVVTTNPDCVESSDYATRTANSGYGDNEACSITGLPLVPTTVVYYDTEAGYDYIEMDGQQYSGTSGPAGVVPTGGTMQWYADG